MVRPEQGNRHSLRVISLLPDLLPHYPVTVTGTLKRLPVPGMPKRPPVKKRKYPKKRSFPVKQGKRNFRNRRVKPDPEPDCPKNRPACLPVRPKNRKNCLIPVRPCCCCCCPRRTEASAARGAAGQAPGPGALAARPGVPAHGF